MKHIICLFICCLLLFATACQDDTDTGNEVITLALPKGFPPPLIPSDNEPTENRVSLGRLLFFDPILSRDSTISCSSCHHEDKAFSDGLVVSKGIDNRHTPRNSPSILNAAYLPTIFWDGGVPNLEQQVLAPIENPNEMDFDINQVVARLNNNAGYRWLFNQAYNQAPSVYTLTRAIACFERTLLTGRSKFDEYQYYNNTTALTESEINGMNLFFGERGECFHCHSAYVFTDFSFKNNGLYLEYADSGRAHITLNPNDVGKFKVPSLRNCEKTAPYMHDGSIPTLEAVVEHYSSGGKPHPNKSGLIKAINLTPQEKTDLVNFLKALNDQ